MDDKKNEEMKEGEDSFEPEQDSWTLAGWEQANGGKKMETRAEEMENCAEDYGRWEDRGRIDD